MWWKKRDRNVDSAAWAARLEAGERDDGTLALAARLDAAAAQGTAAPDAFKTQLEARLMAQHAAQMERRAPHRFQRIARLEHWWLAALALVLALIVGFGLLGELRAGPADAQSGFTVPESWRAAGLTGALWLSVALFAASLVFLIVWSLYLWLAKPRQASPYWNRLAVRSMVMSVCILVAIFTVGPRIAPSLVQTTVSPAVLMHPSPVREFSYSSVPDSVRANSLATSSVRSARLGFAVDGAKDIANFRENIANGYLPLPNDVTAEGLFYDYYFDTGETEPCAALFCPSYARAVSPDPLTGTPELFLAVGLNSGIREEDFQRKGLNLVIVLDVSDSMNAFFDQYYYDTVRGSTGSQDRPDAAETKLRVASTAVAGLLDHLEPEDRLGIVFFNDTAQLAEPIRTMGEMDLARVADRIATVGAQGGTHLESGYRLAEQMLSPWAGQDPERYENRIIFITDAQPNSGEITQQGLLGMTQAAAEQGIYTTFVGVGVDFNSLLIESIGKVRGANYYAVHSAEEFLERMDSGFEYMVTPLVFDLELTFAADGYEIERVYGAPLANRATGRILHVNTLFPSESKQGEVKGGLVLLQLRRHAQVASLSPATLTVTYRDRSGAAHQNSVAVPLPQLDATHYDNGGIRKGILLARYATLLQDWLADTRTSGTVPIDREATSGREFGSPLARPAETRSVWERTSLPLAVSPAYREIFDQFAAYFATEAAAVDDPTLAQEQNVLDRLSTLDGQSER